MSCFDVCCLLVRVCCFVLVVIGVLVFGVWCLVFWWLFFFVFGVRYLFWLLFSA